MGTPRLHYILDSFIWLTIMQMKEEFTSQQLIRRLREFGSREYLEELLATSAPTNQQWRMLHSRIGARLVVFERNHLLKRLGRVSDYNIHGRKSFCQKWRRLV